MRLQDDPPLHLTYCLNIHPGETWNENLAAIQTHALAVKRQVCPDAPFGLGLRLSNTAAHELSEENTLNDFRAFLDVNDLYVFTVNGFPYGTFHGTPVKSNVYRPDWRTRERIDYTNLLADVLAALLSDGITGSISTVPGSYRLWIASHEDRNAITANLSACAEHLARLRDRTGKDITLALEPEPDCLIEHTDDALDFFANVTDDTFRRHVGICVDLCHLAVAFDDPTDSIRRLNHAGILIPKVQLSAALRCTPTPEAMAQLHPFCDPIYLHQVKARSPEGKITAYEDLSVAMDQHTPAAEWRIHFHVPLFMSDDEALQSTSSLYTPQLARILTSGVTEHLEIETYTFDVLPQTLREKDVTASIAREFAWVRGMLKA